MKITANDVHFQILNEQVRTAADRKVVIENCIGQRYIGAGLKDKDIIINGTPGNALGAYMDGANITVNGSVQDATGDTMNDGCITIHGDSGDATGYAMRGGEIYVRGSVGYRAGIHMKAYQEKLPVLVVGGTAGSFLGEYQAGGLIIVLGLGSAEGVPVGNFCGTGMHGGKIFIRTKTLPPDLPAQVHAAEAAPEDLLEIEPYLKQFSEKFGVDQAEILSRTFYVLTANSKNPYKRLYVNN